MSYSEYDVVCVYDVGRTCAERALDVCCAGACGVLVVSYCVYDVVCVYDEDVR